MSFSVLFTVFSSNLSQKFHETWTKLANMKYVREPNRKNGIRSTYYDSVARVLPFNIGPIMYSINRMPYDHSDSRPTISRVDIILLKILYCTNDCRSSHFCNTLCSCAPSTIYRKQHRA